MRSILHVRIAKQIGRMPAKCQYVYKRTHW